MVVYNIEDMGDRKHWFEHADRNGIFLRERKTDELIKISYSSIEVEEYDESYVNVSEIDRIRERNKKEMESKLQKARNAKS